MPPALENRTLRSSSVMSCLQTRQKNDLARRRLTQRLTRGKKSFTHGMFDRCIVAEGGKMFWKFLEPGFLKRCSGEFVKSLVRPWSSKPSLGNWTVWCFDIVTRTILENIFCPFKWLIAERHQCKWNIMSHVMFKVLKGNTRKDILRNVHSMIGYFKNFFHTQEMSCMRGNKWYKKVTSYLTKLSLVHIGHLNQRAVLLIKENLHALHVPINPCEKSEQTDRRQKRGQSVEWDSESER